MAGRHWISRFFVCDSIRFQNCTPSKSIFIHFLHWRFCLIISFNLKPFTDPTGHVCVYIWMYICLGLQPLPPPPPPLSPRAPPWASNITRRLFCNSLGGGGGDIYTTVRVTLHRMRLYSSDKTNPPKKQCLFCMWPGRAIWLLQWR